MPKSPTVLFVGIDVDKIGLHVALAQGSQQPTHLEFTNDPDGHHKLLKRLFKGSKRTVRVVMEPTGTYHFELALKLVEAGAEVCLLNPKAARRFAEAQMRRAKTDRVDALVLLSYAQRMSLTLWQPPGPVVIELRSLASRVYALTNQKTAEQNRLEALAGLRNASKLVLDDIQAAINSFEQRISRLEAAAEALVRQDPKLLTWFNALHSIKGVGVRTAIVLIAELTLLPEDMTSREVVAHAGLDPRPVQSGKRDPTRRISRIGNSRLRSALFFPAFTAVQHQPAIREHYERLLARGKAKLLALTAVMRRMLTVAWAMRHNPIPFDDNRFRPAA